MNPAHDQDSVKNQEKLYFQVLINYIEGNEVESPGVNTQLETGALGTFVEASDAAMRVADKFLSTVSGSNLVELEPEQQTDEYHIFVVDIINSVVVAKLGIIAIDYTDAIIH